MFTPSVPNEWIRLAKIAAAASNAEIPSLMRDAVPVNLLGQVEYRTQDVYEMLRWLKRVRNTLTEAKSSNSHKLPSAPTGRRSRPSTPGAWEIRQIETPINGIGQKIRLILRRLFRADPWMLVDFKCVELLQRLVGVIESLGYSASPLACIVYNTAKDAIEDFSLRVEGEHRVCFHPRLDLASRQRYVDELMRWWPTFALDVSLLDPIGSLLRKTNENYENCSEDDGDLSTAVLLLNVIFAVACGKLSSVSLLSLRRRWHLPSELRQPQVTLTDIGCYIVHLHRVELAFAMTLVTDVRDQLQSMCQESQSSD